MKSNFFKTYFIAIIIAFVAILFDMLTKYLLIGLLIPNVGDEAGFIDGFINFVYVQNFGASWGIFSGQTWLLIIISLLIMAGLLWFYISKCKAGNTKVDGTTIFLSVIVGLIVGGCIGNLYDRLVFGYVRDFINLQFIDFPVFNIADCAITIGVVLFIIYFIVDFVKDYKAEKAKTAKDIRKTGQNQVDKDKNQTSTCQDLNSKENLEKKDNLENKENFDKKDEKNDDKTQ